MGYHNVNVFFISCILIVCSLQPAKSNTLHVPLWEDGNTEGWALTELLDKFAAIEPIELKQAWLPEFEPGFNPTAVWVVWKPEGLFLFARLEDDAINSSSTHYNQRLWELGDVFESFFLFEGAEAYYEFHVSSNNHVLQLRFDLDLTPAQRRLQLPKLFMPEQVIKSQVWVEEDQHQWYVFFMIPHSILKPDGALAAGDSLKFSFSRYDYCSESKEPVLSSSSDHQELDFHRHEDWGTMILKVR